MLLETYEQLVLFDALTPDVLGISLTTSYTSHNTNMSSLVDYLSQQEQLEKEAREQMPYDPKDCTFKHGPLRQELYACLTCYRQTKQRNAVCYACSIKCHTSHDLIELFTKRTNACDCGTSRVNGACCVRYPAYSNNKLTIDDNFTPDIPCSDNLYNHNFEGRFCHCDTQYNPLTDSNMLQCTFGVECGEDWYHEECIMGLKPGVMDRTPPKLRKLQGENRLDQLGEPSIEGAIKTSTSTREENSSVDDDDDGLDVLPLPDFPSLDDFDSIICWKCCSRFADEMKQLQQLLKARVVEHVPSENIDERISKIQGSSSTTSDTDIEQRGKRARKTFPQTIFLPNDYKSTLKEYSETNKETGLSKLLERYPFLYSDDPVHTPPEDDDDSSSVFELGVRELKNVPADQAAQGLAAYDKIKSKLTEFLRPFAEEGKIVTEEEVKAFFGNVKKET